jgi:hypothetical protein
VGTSASLTIAAVSYIKRIIDHAEVAPYLDPKAPQSSWSALDSPRSKCYPYMVGAPTPPGSIADTPQVQESLEQELLLDCTGIPPEAFSIAPAIASGQFSLPPSYFVHGT